MKILRNISVILGVLLLSGCGDQIWCGENGCGQQKSVLAPDSSTIDLYGSLADKLN